MNSWLNFQLRCLKKNILNEKIKQQGLIIITSTGVPGWGKTTLGQQISYFMDNKFNLDACTFTTDDFIDETYNGNYRCKVIMFDEALEGFDNTRQLTNEYNNLRKFLTECRTLGPFHVLCTPSLFSLPMDMVINRANFIINMEANYIENPENEHKEWDEKQPLDLELGIYKVYGRGTGASRLLYLKGCKMKNYHAAFPDWEGKSHELMVLNPEEYEAKKQQAIRNRRTESKPYNPYEKHLADLALNLKLKHNIQFNDTADMAGILPTQLCTSIGKIQKIQSDITI